MVQSGYTGQHTVWSVCVNIFIMNELHKEQEYYWVTKYRAGAAVVSTITSVSISDPFPHKINIVKISYFLLSSSAFKSSRRWSRAMRWYFDSLEFLLDHKINYCNHQPKREGWESCLLARISIEMVIKAFTNGGPPICHGKTKNLTAKTKYLTAKPKTSRQKQNTSRQNRKPHGKNKNFTAKPSSRQKQNTSRQNQNPHDKTKDLTAKPNTSQQNPNTSRPKQIPTAKPKLFCCCCEVFGFAVRYFVFAVEVFGFAVMFSFSPWGFWFRRDSCGQRDQSHFFDSLPKKSWFVPRPYSSL